MYLKEIRDESLLTAAEECTLAEAIARGDKDARSRMIQANLRLVVKIARDYMGRGMVLEDLIGEGNLGLIRATEEFQPRFGTRFSTYAGLLDQAVDPPRSDQHDVDDPFARPHGWALDQMEAQPSGRSVANWAACPASTRWRRMLGLSETQKSLVAKALQARQLKLESSIAVGAGWRSVLGCRRPHTRPPMPCWKPATSGTFCASRMERLDARERTILVLRYGLEGESPLTLKEIGRRLGVTREWVRKIEIRAVRKLDNSDEREPAAGPPAIGPSSAPACSTESSGRNCGSAAVPGRCPAQATGSALTRSRARSGRPGSRPEPSPRHSERPAAVHRQSADILPLPVYRPDLRALQSGACRNLRSGGTSAR